MYAKVKAAEVPANVPDKVGVSFWLEPEDAELLDRFCSMVGRSRAAVLRVLVSDLVSTPGVVQRWRERWAQEHE